MAGQAKYIMVKEKIKEWITTGEVQPGEKVHSENELVKLFQVSRHTIRQAIGELVHEGWLYREQGAGTFCSKTIQQAEPEPKRQEVKTNSKNIGVITTYISDYIFPSIIRGIESYLTEKGYTLTFASTNNDVETEKQCLQSMLSRKIDGLIVEPTRSGSFNPNINYYLELEKNEIPYLMINQYYPQLNPPHIILDDEKGGYIATDHLIKLGHEKIIGIFKNDDLQGFNRMQGFIRAFRENHTPIFPDMIFTYSTENKESTLDQIRNLFTPLAEKPTAIVCYNDQIALNIINSLRELEIKIPEEISIVGFDDSFLAEASEIKLTSVKHPKEDMGIEAAKWIVNAIENGQPHDVPSSIVYEPELVIRSSTAELKKRIMEN